MRILSALKPRAGLIQDFPSIAAALVFFMVGVSLFGSAIASAIIAWCQP